jgi:hypothetical protein
MRESLMYGSVRGARGNSRPYRDEHFCSEFCADDADEARFRVQHTASSSGATATHSAQP